MSIDSPAVLELIRREMALGQYASEEALLLDALHELAERRLALDAIREGLEDIAAGRVQSAHEFDAEFETRKGLR